jgi:two-component system, NtrC family, response regulator AtoC
VELRVSGPGWHTGASGTVSHAAFVRALSDEVTRGRLYGRTATVIALRGELPEAGEELGPTLKPLDRQCPYRLDLRLVLLPERDADQAHLWFQGLPTDLREALRAGTASYPELACTPEQLISRALDACHGAPVGAVNRAALAKSSDDKSALLLNPRMLRVYEIVAKAARTPLPVLIQGETGSGKELVARAVHDKSSRSKGPFIALNCATIPVNLIESILFGHERGAFTGAERQRLGLFEQARGGTVFLDEVGELSAQAQAALLRVLEQRQIVRVGGSTQIDLDVRVVTATHRDLVTLVKAGAFRQDLMFRLDALTIRLPPLRERKEEITPLAELFVARAREQWAASATQLSEEVKEALLAFAWPGNVRQLKNVIERAVAVCASETIALEDLPEELWNATNEAASEENLLAGEGDTSSRSLPQRVRDFEIALVRSALERAQGSHGRAAQLLGIPRRTLSHKIQVYGLG